MMKTFAALLSILLVPLGSWAAREPGCDQGGLPKKSGVFAMTPNGPVQMKISGERNSVEQALGLKVNYASRDFDRIPVVDAVQSFYVSLADWAPKDLYMVVGRDRLTNPLSKYERFSARAVTRGLVAFEILATDLTPAALLRMIRRLTPAGVADADIEAYIVLEIKSTTGLNDRAYPVRVTVPKE